MSLEFEANQLLRCALVLSGGRRITLDRLVQYPTYAGVVEGLPSRGANDVRIETALMDAQSLCVEGAKPHLIPPLRRDYFREPGDMATVWSEGLQPEWLPMVTCAARFLDAAPVRDRSSDASTLTVVWFQDEFAMPIAETALLGLKALDWSALATDFEW